MCTHNEHHWEDGGLIGLIRNQGQTVRCTRDLCSSAARLLLRGLSDGQSHLEALFALRTIHRAATADPVSHDLPRASAQLGSALPWSFTREAERGDFLYVSAQIDTSPDSGSITVQIIKDGDVYKSANAVGFPNIATASGSIPTN